MNLTKKFTSFVLLLLCISTSFAQNAEQGGFLSNFGVAPKFGLLYGGGADVSTSLHPNLKLRAGFSYFGLDAAKFIDSDDDITLDKANFNFSNGNVLVDYFPSQNGIFHLTAGFYFGHNKVEFKGEGFDEFAINDYVIKPQDGKFTADVKFGSALKPYFGIGLGRTIPNSRVGFKFELGAVYQGSFDVDSPYLDPNADPSDVDDAIDIDILESKVWPMMTFSLTFRII